MRISINSSRALTAVIKAAAVAAVVGPVVAGHAMAGSVGVTWQGKSNTAKLVAENFLKRMAEAAPDIKVEAKGEQKGDAAFAGVVSEFDASKDAIVVLRSEGAQYLAKNPTKKPGFIGGGANPVELGVIKNLERPEGNITGVTQWVPHATSLQAFMTIMPSLSKLTVFLQKDHPASAVDKAGVSASCAKLELTCEFFEGATAEELTAKASQISGAGAAIALGSQTLINNNAKQIVDAAPKTPVFAFSERPVADGATAGLVADNAKLGRRLADMVVDAVRNGKAVKDLPVAVDDEPKLLLNMNSVKRLEITISADVLNSATIVE